MKEELVAWLRKFANRIEAGEVDKFEWVQYIHPPNGREARIAYREME